VITFWKALRRGLDDAQSRTLIVVVLVFMATGTVFYTLAEGWPLLDSLYFTVVALTTVGFGDLSPETDIGKAFTIVYLLVGVSLLVAFGTTILRLSGEIRSERDGRRVDRDEDGGD